MCMNVVRISFTRELPVITATLTHLPDSTSTPRNHCWIPYAHPSSSSCCPLMWWSHDCKPTELHNILLPLYHSSINPTGSLYEIDLLDPKGWFSVFDFHVNERQLYYFNFMTLDNNMHPSFHCSHEFCVCKFPRKSDCMPFSDDVNYCSLLFRREHVSASIAASLASLHVLGEDDEMIGYDDVTERMSAGQMDTIKIEYSTENYRHIFTDYCHPLSVTAEICIAEHSTQIPLSLNPCTHSWEASLLSQRHRSLLRPGKPCPMQFKLVFPSNPELPHPKQYTPILVRSTPALPPPFPLPHPPRTSRHFHPLSRTSLTADVCDQLNYAFNSDDVSSSLSNYFDCFGDFRPIFCNTDICNYSQKHILLVSKRPVSFYPYREAAGISINCSSFPSLFSFFLSLFIYLFLL